MKIYTDNTKSYVSGIEAVEELGFKHIGTITITTKFRQENRHLFEKDGVQYYWKSMDNFNLTIYSVVIEKVEELKGDYYIQKF